MIELRQYQQDIEDAIQGYWKNGRRRILIQAPTGSGKGTIFCDIAYKCSSKTNKVLIYAP